MLSTAIMHSIKLAAGVGTLSSCGIFTHYLCSVQSRLHTYIHTYIQDTFSANVTFGVNYSTSGTV